MKDLQRIIDIAGILTATYSPRLQLKDFGIRIDSAVNLYRQILYHYIFLESITEFAYLSACHARTNCLHNP